MRIIPTAQFAAERRREQDRLIDVLLPAVNAALDRLPDDDWWDALLQVVEDEYAAAFNREGGQVITRLDTLMVQVRASLNHIEKPLPTTAEHTATALAVAILNYSIMDAADDDPEPLVMEWVTMHDEAVRDTHQAAEGQQQPAGEKFTVGGVEMLAPGDMSAPIEEWINCRCVLAPALMTMVAATEDPGSPETFISEKPWDGSASRFTPEEWKRSCILHKCAGLEKSCHSLPIKEPGGALSRAGVHAAAGRLNQVDASPEKKNSAKRVLRGAYRQLGEDPPDSLAAALQAPEAPDEEEPMMSPLQWHGVLAPEGEWSGDGRMFAKDSLTFRDLPLPLTWQKQSADGHDGSIVVGSIDQIERRDNLLHAAGTFLSTLEADELVGLIAHFGKFGVSVDADDVEFEFQEQDNAQPKMVFSAARVSSASVVPIPAFPQAWIALGPESDEALAAASWTTWTTGTANSTTLTFNGHRFGRGPGWITNPEDTRRIHAYWTQPGQEGYAKIGWGAPGDFERCRSLVGEKIAENSPEDVRFLNQICAQWHHDATGFWPGRAPTEQASHPDGDPAEAITLVAAAGIVAPHAWFTDPGFTRRQPLTVTDDGQVYGHIAEWGTCHVGFDGVCVEPPPSAANYAYFLTGEVLTDTGPVPVGHLTAGGGHAGMRLSANEAVAHYDSTSMVVADVTCGEDEVGIWVAGWVRPGISDDQRYTLRASAISGDWRTIRGSMELIACHCVNSPGFPVTRVAAGQQLALVAAGMIPQPKEGPGHDVEVIVDRLAEQVAAALEARQQRREKMAQLAVRVGGEK